MVKKLFIIVAVALAGCNSDEVEITTGSETGDDLFVKPEVVIGKGEISLSKAQGDIMDGYEAFALTTTRDLMPEDKNFAYSPLSATLALSLVANAADGTTYDELVTAMGFKGKDIEEINRLNYTLQQALPALNDVELSFANALFASEEYDLLRPFKSRLTDAYDGRFFTLKSKQEAAQINEWVSEKTNGLITDLMEESDFNGNPGFAFVNACYLKGQWFNAFTRTEERPFTQLDGSQTPVQYAVEPQRISYTNIDGMEVVALPLGTPMGITHVFEGDLVLPAPGQSVSKAIAAISDKGGFSAIGNAMETDIVVKLNIPKFKISEKVDLVEWLKQNGVKVLFEPTADLFKMSLTPSCVVKVNQRCEFELDENGVSGAAATDNVGLASLDKDPPEYREIVIDRPFAFCVREASSSAILFIGQVVQP